MKEKVKNLLAKKEWAYMENEDIIKLDINGESFTWSSFIKCDEEYSLSYFSVLPTRIPQEKMQQFLLLVNEINCRLWYGSFELITDEEARGQLRLRTATIIPPETAEKTEDTLIDGVLSMNMAAMNMYGGALMKAIYSDDVKLDDYI